MTKLIKCLAKEKNSCFPVWFMRQAGRYLPEFRKIRLKNKNFIKLCLNSKLSSKITLQPLKRFDLDGAIIFSDILITPYGLGQKVNFKKNYGPVLSALDIDKFLNINDKDFIRNLQPVYKAIKITRKKLNKKKSLISFVGSPWTLAVYMLGLKSKKNTLNLKLLHKKKYEINLIIDKLVHILSLHIKNQIKAGSDVVQLFDSWAGIIPKKELNKYCFLPNKKIVAFCNKKKIPVICFPKGIKSNYLNFLKIVKPNAINIDYDVNPSWAKKNFKGICIQGGMNPKFMLLKKKQMIKHAEKYLKIFKNYPYIFNLGHGLLPQTNPDNVKALIKFIREYK